MRKMGRSRGRARERALSKAYSRGAAAAFATANRSAQPRRVALGDAINALTAGPGRTNGLVIDDETRWMMRDPRDDTDFGPINPLRPDAIDPVRPDTRRPEPRLSEYPVAWNLPGSADQPVPWATLRAAAENVDIMRRCISVRKEQLQGLDWSITLDDQTVQGMHAAAAGDTGREDIEAELRRKLLPEIDRLTTFWRNPWKANGVSFEQWVNGIMEDHLVLDAVSIYPRTTYGGELSAFELIDPTTIKLLIDYRGARPVAPFPAFQQILYGFPRAEFGSCYEADGDDAVKPVEGLLADQLFYFREEYRSFTPYGYSAVQQALISARLYLRRQGWMLAEYDDGSTPLTFLVPDATDGTLVEQLTPKTRRQWEDSINAELAGQTRARNRMKVLMPGMTPHQMTGVDERYKPDYDMHLIKMLAGHFGVTSTGLGFSESKGLGNSGLHEGQERTQDAATTKPDKRMIERIVNELMCTYQGAPAELRFKFTDPDTEDQAAEDASADAQRARGTITLNDDRKRIGKAPFPFPEADMPMVKVGDGWMPLEGMAQRAEQQAEAEQALVEDQLANSEAQREATATEAEELSGETAEKALELAAYRRWARKRGGDARRPFICKALAPSDWPGEQVPADVDFAEWVWVPDGLPDDASDDVIEKAFGQGNDNWRTLARDSRGRWVKRGSMRVDALGPSAPDKPVIASLRADAERRRAASTAPNPAARQLPVSDSSSTMGGMTAPIESARAARTAASARVDALAAARRDGDKTPENLAALDAANAELNAATRAVVAAERAERERTGVDAVDTSAARVRGREGYTSEGDEMSAQDARDRAAQDALSAPASREQIEATYRAADKRRVAAYAAYAASGHKDDALRAEYEAARLDADRARLHHMNAKDAEESAGRPVKLTSTKLRTLQVMAADPDRLVYASMAGQPGIHAHSVDGLLKDGALERYENPDPVAAASPGGMVLVRMTDKGRAALAGGEPAKPRKAQRRDAAVDDASVRDAVTSLQDAPGGWVSMVDVRRKLDDAGLSRAEQDAAIRRLATEGDRALNMAPEDNQKTLTEADHAAAVDFGAGPQHVLSLDPPRRSVLDTVRESSEQAAAARAVIDSVPGLREGVARQQKPITPDGRAILSAVAAVEARGGVYSAGGQSRRAATAKLVRDGYLAERSEGGYALTEAGRRNANVNDPELVTVREEGRQNNPGFALPTTPPAATRDSRIAAALADIPAVERKVQRGRGERYSAVGRFHDTPEQAEAARRAEAERLVDREDRAGELERAATEADERGDVEAAAIARADRAQMRYEDAQSRTDYLGDLADALDTDEARARHDAAIVESDRLRAEVDAAEDAVNAAQRPRLLAEMDADARRRGEHLARINAERAERERKAAEDAAAEVERKAREREENARRVAEIQAETRAELARRTPEAFALMLDGGDKATTHAPSRKILAEMREQGWIMTHMNGSMMRFEAPDGRGIRMTYGKDRVKWERGDYKGNQTMGESISLTAAAALVNDKPTPAARAEAVAASTPDAPSAALAGDTVRPVHIPASITGDERTKLEAFAANNAKASSAAIAEGRAELERDIVSARGFIEAEGPGSVAGQRMAQQLEQMERMAALPRGDAALESVKAARDLVAKAEAEGYVVRVGHFSASGGAPFFKVEAMNPETKNGFEATWHSGKGDGSKYGLDRVTLKGSKHGYGGKASSLKGVNEAIERDRPVMVDTEALAAELNARRNVDPSVKMTPDQVERGDWRWNDGIGEWQKIGAIADRPDAVGGRTIWDDNEQRLGAIPREGAYIARQAERPTLPPRAAGLKGLQRKPGEPTKRGDVLIVERKDTTYYGGNTGTRNPRTSYEVYEVTSVTREGEPRKVRRFDSSTDMDVKHALSHRLGHGKRSIVPGDAIDKEGLNADLAARTYRDSTTRRDHDDLRELGDVLYGRMKPTA